jgi:hypothetical protein
MLKTFVLLLLSLPVLTGCARDPEVDFALNLYLLSDEQSDDSNSVTETLEMEGVRGNYTWSYYGYHPGEPPADVNEDFKLTEEQVESLKLFIKDQGLNMDLAEEKPMDELGRRMEFTLSVTMNGESTEISMKGMSYIWENGGDGSGNLDNIALIEAAQSLIYTVKDLGGLYED